MITYIFTVLLMSIFNFSTVGYASGIDYFEKKVGHVSYPYTHQEKIVAAALLSLPVNIRSWQEYPLLRIVLEYYWGLKEYEWVHMPPLEGQLSFSFQHKAEKNCLLVYVRQHQEGRIISSRLLVPEKTRFDGEDLMRLVKYMQAPDSLETFMLHSQCQQYKIEVSKYQDKITLFRHVALKGAKRAQELMEPTIFDRLKMAMVQTTSKMKLALMLAQGIK